MQILTALFMYVITVIIGGIVLMFIDRFDLINLVVYIGAIVIGTLILGALNISNKTEKKPKKKKQEIEFL